ncbi:hypothetical protein [Lichenicoccus sp.]|uniref:hypothetical protein n=1 Tax=Lichenicoccus sp. TaxID=2781899 RepID=UPI003D12B005
MSALTGTIIGGATTFASSWLTRTQQFRAERAAEQREKREELYGRFLDEAIRLVMSTGGNGAADFVAIRAVYMRILLVASDDVVALAQQIISGLENDAARAGAGMAGDTGMQLTGFARACRRELKALRR